MRAIFETVLASRMAASSGRCTRGFEFTQDQLADKKCWQIGKALDTNIKLTDLPNRANGTPSRLLCKLLTHAAIVPSLHFDSRAGRVASADRVFVRHLPRR